MAQILAAKGMKVFAIDNDPQANLTSSFLENPTELKSNLLKLGVFASHMEYDLWGKEAEAVDKTFEVFKGTIPLPGT